MAEIIYKEESYSIIGACFEVYKEMGCSSWPRSFALKSTITCTPLVTRSASW